MEKDSLCEHVSFERILTDRPGFSKASSTFSMYCVHTCQRKRKDNMLSTEIFKGQLITIGLQVCPIHPKYEQKK